MSNILSFPTATVRAITPQPTVAPTRQRGLHGVQQRRFMDFAELIDRLGLDCFVDRRTQIEKLRLLHDQAGMPPPHTPHSKGRRLLFGADAIHAGARWERGRMLTWLDNPIGPDSDPGGVAGHAAPLDLDHGDREIARLTDRARALCTAKRA